MKSRQVQLFQMGPHDTNQIEFNLLKNMLSHIDVI